MNPSIPPVTAIAVAVVVVGHHVLVGKRSHLAREGPGLDEFPGGKVERGELGDEAARRECLEETGLDVQILRTLDVSTGSASFGPLEVTFFLARPRGLAQGEPLPKVSPPFAWRTMAEIARLTFPQTNRRVVAMLSDLLDESCTRQAIGPTNAQGGSKPPGCQG